MATEETKVERTEDGETIGTGNDARLALLNQINDENDKSRGDEFANVNDDGSTEPFLEAASEESVSQENLEDDPTAVTEMAPAVEQPKIKIRVNGKDLELTQEELIARAQKVESADEYLRAAKHGSPKEQSQDLIPQPEAVDLKALTRAIQTGTEDEASEALGKLIAQASTRPSVSTDDVSRTVDERLAFTTALQTFRTEYKDIVSDPFLNKLAIDKDAELRAAGDVRPYAERYDEIGKSLRAWKQSLVKDVHPAASDMQTKLEKKASAPKPVTTASVKTRAPVVEDDTDESPTDVIRAMAKSRGGPQWMRN